MRANGAQSAPTWARIAVGSDVLPPRVISHNVRFTALSRPPVDRVSVQEPSHRLSLRRNLRGNSAVVTRCLRRPFQSCPSEITGIASRSAPTTADCEPANVAKPRRRVVHRTELHCESFLPATAKSTVRLGRPSLASPRSLPPLQIAARRSGRVDKSAPVLVAQYACSLVFVPDLLDRSNSCY
jgi:hypothetical protein